jgi:hypothetical protein
LKEGVPDVLRFPDKSAIDQMSPGQAVIIFTPDSNYHRPQNSEAKCRPFLPKKL